MEYPKNILNFATKSTKMETFIIFLENNLKRYPSNKDIFFKYVIIKTVITWNQYTFIYLFVKQYAHTVTSVKCFIMKN